MELSGNSKGCLEYNDEYDLKCLGISSEYFI